MIVDMLKGDRRIKPHRVCIDHVEEHTVRVAKDHGFWCAMTLYPLTKCTPARAADIIEMYGDERIMVNSAGDWGPSAADRNQVTVELKWDGKALVHEIDLTGQGEKTIYALWVLASKVPPAGTNSPIRTVSSITQR